VTITSMEFKTYLESYFSPGDALAGFDWDYWFHEPGMPKEAPNFDRTLSSASEKLAADWIAFDASGGKGGVPSADISGWITNQTTCFLDAILSAADKEGGKPLKSATTMKMDEVYGFSRTKNSEVLFRFCAIAIAAEQSSILPVCLRFITTVGRMKYVRPLYRSLFASTMGKAAAVQTYVRERATRAQKRASGSGAPTTSFFSFVRAKRAGAAGERKKDYRQRSPSDLLRLCEQSGREQRASSGSGLQATFFVCASGAGGSSGRAAAAAPKRPPSCVYSLCSPKKS
jgi:hypothetical protein